MLAVYKSVENHGGSRQSSRQILSVSVTLNPTKNLNPDNLVLIRPRS
jgi:hypothetical protein